MEYIQIIADIATAVAVFIALGSLLDSRKIYQEDKLHEKKKDTLDAYNRLQNEVFDKLFLEYNAKDIEEIAKHYRTQNREYTKLSTYLAKIEHFSVGVINEIYDVETTYELAHGFFDKKVRDSIKPMLDRKRSFYEYDPFENTKKLYLKMDAITEERKNQAIDRM